MKRILSALCISALLISAVGCSGQAVDLPGNNSSSVSEDSSSVKESEASEESSAEETSKEEASSEEISKEESSSEETSKPEIPAETTSKEESYSSEPAQVITWSGPSEETDYSVFSGEDFTIKADGAKWEAVETDGMDVSYMYLSSDETISIGVQVLSLNGTSITAKQIAEQTKESLTATGSYSVVKSEEIKIKGNDAYLLISEMKFTDDIKVVLDQRFQVHNGNIYVFQSAYSSDISDTAKSDMEDLLDSFTFID